MGFGWHNPVDVRFGDGVLDTLPARLAGRRAVLVTFPEAAAIGLRSRAEALIGTALAGVVDDVEPNPGVDWFRDRYARHWREHRGAVLVAIGGGSAIDTAKLLAIGVPGDDFESYAAALRAGRAPAVADAMPVIAVPTTAGTGSEVTPWATLWDRSRREPGKYSLHVPQAWPESALVDPALAGSAPMAVTRNSALDALSHALEAIWNVNHNPVSDALAVEAARGVVGSLPARLETPGDVELRTAMSRASLLAGLAFSNTRTALAHSVSYGMTLRHGLPHGLACSFTLPLVWRLARGADAGRDRVLGRVFPDAADGPSALEAFLARVGVGTRFADHGVSLAEARAMVADALDGARGRNFIQPVPPLDLVG